MKENKRDELVLSHMPMVNIVASIAMSKYNLGAQALDDIRSAATVDLIECANSFVITSSSDFSGVEFGAYASKAVEGAAMDEAKRLSWHITITKGQQEKINDGTYPLVFMREISNEFPDDKNKHSDKSILVHQIIRKLLDDTELTERDKFVLTQRYLFHRKLDEICRILDCSKMTVSSIQKKVLQRLKDITI